MIYTILYTDNALFKLNCTDNYDVVKIKVKSVTDNQ